MQLSRTVWLQEVRQSTIKSLPSQKKSVCVCNQGDTRLQPKERINSQVCDLHQPKQEREGPSRSLFAMTSSWSGRTWTSLSPSRSPFHSASCLQGQLVPGAAQQVLPSSQVRGLLSVSNISHMERCYWCSACLTVLTLSQEQAWGSWSLLPLLWLFSLQPGCKAKSRPAPWH